MLGTGPESSAPGAASAFGEPGSRGSRRRPGREAQDSDRGRVLHALLRQAGGARQHPPRPVGVDAAEGALPEDAARARRGAPRRRPRTRRHEARLRQLDVAPAVRAAPEGPAARAAAELVGVHGDVDGACATLQAAWPPHASSDVPDVLAPNLRCVFCGINPGRVSAAAAAHFANPRNDFWRLLHDGGFTPRLFDPQEQLSLLELGLGVTNAAYRTTPGSGDLRRGDFDAGRLEATGARAAAARARVRRQGGLPRRVRRPARARPADPDARLDRPVRPAVDLAGERRRAVRRAAEVVPRAARLARRPGASGRARGRLRRGRPRPARALRERGQRRRLVGDAGRRRRGGRDRRAGAPARAARGDRADASSSSAR